MKWMNLPRSQMARAISVAVLAGVVGIITPHAFAATAAGTQIKNLATVTYEDAIGNVYSAQSNEAVVTVSQVYSATLGRDVDSNAAPGQTVYLPYVLTNTGNGSDTFELSAINGITGGDSIDSASISIFLDNNGNGEPDPGELAIRRLTLPANVNNVANLVIAVDVPATAIDAQTLGVTLKVDAQNGTGSAVALSVIDASAGKGRDQLDGTNESLISVTGDAVLVATKSSVHDAINHQITYTLTVRNNGNRAAQNVVLFDGIPENTRLLSSTVSGILSTNGDILDTNAVLDEVGLSLDLNADGDIADIDELTLGIDLNNDGDTTDSVLNGVYAVDAQLPAQANVSMSFTVSYDPTTLIGGSVVRNVGHVSGDTNEDDAADTLVSSNVRQDVINASYGVTIADTGMDPSPNENDGGDDDNRLNDEQYVDQIAAGGTIIYKGVVQNTGNADDIFELSIESSGFPSGTAFTFFDSTGAVQLTDTNGSGVDSGVIASNSSKTIVIKASLPASAKGGAEAANTQYEAHVLAISANDPALQPVQDILTISLGTIVEAVADLHNTSNGNIGTNEDALGNSPYSAAASYEGARGTNVTIPLYIDNESGSPTAYILSSGSSWDGIVLGALPAGWRVSFFLSDASGSPTGLAITATPVIPANTTDFALLAVVSVPNSLTDVVSNALLDNDGDGLADTLDGNADDDGDYPVFFRIESQETGSSDLILNAIDIDSSRQLSLITPGINHVEPGAKVSYRHTLSNNGNVAEVLELTYSNTLPGWGSSVALDTDGDGVADTVLANLMAGQIIVQKINGVSISVPVSDNDADGDPELTLEPGVSIALLVDVSAPANTSDGQTDVLTLNATNMDDSAGAPSVSLMDQTTAVNGHVRLTKSVAVDADCDGTPETGFNAVQSVGVKPEECAIWQVVAENQGGVDVANVTITDTVPAFSVFQANSLKYCLSFNCFPEKLSDAKGDDAADYQSGSIVFYIGTGADPMQKQGGVLLAGEQATAQFSVKVQ